MYADGNAGYGTGSVRLEGRSEGVVCAWEVGGYVQMETDGEGLRVGRVPG
jgi:hypothetical protein